MKRLVYNLLADADCRYAIDQLRALESKLVSRESRFAIPFVLKGRRLCRRINPKQNPYEIEALYKRICELHPRRVLEIGTARGGSLYLWTQAAADDALIVSVDLPEGDFGGGYPASRLPLYQAFARQGQTMHLLRRDSHDPAVVDEVKQLFADEPIDFAFIDGDHTFEGVKQDFETYGPLVRPGGLIVFHDILARADTPSIQVDRFWESMKDDYAHEELIGPDGSGRRVGIGVITVPEGGLASPSAGSRQPPR